MLMTRAADNAQKRIAVATDSDTTNTNEAGGMAPIVVNSAELLRNERDTSAYDLDDEKMLTIVKKVPVPIPITKVSFW